MSPRSILLTLCAAAWLGCSSSESGASPMPNAGSGGTGGAQAGTGSMLSGGAGGTAGTQVAVSGGTGGGGAGGDTDDPSSSPDAGDDDPTHAELAAADRDTLLGCDAPEPCEPAGAGLTEGQFFAQPASKYECLFGALAARTPGLYRYTTGHTFGNGSWNAEHALLVLEDGEVLYALASTGSYGVPPDWESVPIEGSLRGRRCALKPASYFEDCLTAMTTAETTTDSESVRKARSCVMPGDSAPGPVAWIESCHDESPVACE